MAEEDATGRSLRTQWLAALDEIADIELQRRMWLDPANTNPHWSYVEFVCSFPDNDQLADAHKRGWLSSSEADILVKFGRALFAHQSPTGKDFDHEAVLNDPAWHDIVRAA